jgi:hypothetical protein
VVVFEALTVIILYKLYRLYQQKIYLLPSRDVHVGYFQKLNWGSFFLDVIIERFQPTTAYLAIFCHGH